VSAYVNGRLVSEPTANVALAKTVEWHVVRKLADVPISDGIKSIRLMVLHRQWRSRRLRARS